MQVLGSGFVIDMKSLVAFMESNQQSIGRIKAIIETSMSMYPEVFTDK